MYRPTLSLTWWELLTRKPQPTSQSENRSPTPCPCGSAPGLTPGSVVSFPTCFLNSPRTVLLCSPSRNRGPAHRCRRLKHEMSFLPCVLALELPSATGRDSRTDQSLVGGTRGDVKACAHPPPELKGSGPSGGPRIGSPASPSFGLLILPVGTGSGDRRSLRL